MAFKLDDIEMKILQEAVASNVYDEDIRLKSQIILDFFQIPQKLKTCKKYNTTVRTIQRWIKKFKDAGINGTSKEAQLNALKNQPFKKRAYLSCQALEALLPEFAKNPVEYGLTYSTWDDFTVKEFLNKYHPDTSDAPAVIKKIINTCKSRYMENFFDCTCQDTDYYEAFLAHWLSSDIHRIICWKNYYLGFKATKDVKQYYFAWHFRINNDSSLLYYDIKVLQNKKFTSDLKYKMFKESVKVIKKEKNFYKPLTFLFLIDDSITSRQAIRELKKTSSYPDNIQFLTLSNDVQKHLGCFKPMRNIQNQIYTGTAIADGNITKAQLINDSRNIKFNFNGRTLATVKKYFVELANMHL